MPTAESPARHSGFRPDIEGLRAVAILTVLAHHAGLPLHGGFIGVDIFFVISGFLITGLLVTELWTTGTISWSRFVGRRIRRLLPAAVLVLVLTSLVSYLVVPGLRRRDIGVDIAASAAYVVNWVFARREVDYLASDIRPSPVQHFWSLAVEEQFYVLWPLLLIVLALVVRRPSRRVVLGALGVLVAVSIVWSIWFSDTSPRPAFFTTTTRVWELGVGAMLAVALAGRPRPASPVRGARVLGWAALLTLVAVAVLLPDGIDWPGAWALLPTVPTAVLLWLGWQSGGGHGAGRVLGLAPMVWIGGLSYSIYLWHWPFIVLGEWTADAVGTTLPAWGKVALAVASIGPAWLSWRFVETPIHHGPWLRERPRALLVSGLALSLVGVLAALPLLPLRSPFTTTPPDGVVVVADLGAATVVPGRVVTDVDDPGWVTPDPLVAGEDRPAADVDRCQVDHAATEPVACTFGDPDGARTIALVGDSKAMQWLPALEAVAAERGWRIITWGKSACAFAAAPAAEAGVAYPECDAWNEAVVRSLDQEVPDVVVTSGVARSAWAGEATDRGLLVQGYADRWRWLTDRGVPVVVVGDSPLSPDDLDICAARNPRELGRCTFAAQPAVAGSGLPVQQDAVALVVADPSPEARAGSAVELLDLTPWICPGGQCPVVIGHVAVHRAGDHVTATYASTLAPQLAAAVDQALTRAPQ